MKDIERVLGSQSYTRLRVGVGGGGGGSDMVGHVLGEFSQHEQEMLPHVVDHVAQRVEHWVRCAATTCSRGLCTSNFCCRCTQGG